MDGSIPSRATHYVQGHTEDEAIAFLAACAQIEETKWGFGTPG